MGSALMVVANCVVLGTIIWIGIDSHQHRIPVSNAPYTFNNGWLAWVLTGVFLWAFGVLPYYCVKRTKATAGPQGFGASEVTMIVGGFAAWALVLTVVVASIVRRSAV